jgi:endonuclease/exonuclease/phosphatase (EEP) superfamily protein YafD
LLEAGAALTAALSVATVFDGLHRHLELFSHFRLQYLGVALLLAVLFAVIRSKRYLALMLATVALNAWYVAPWYQPVDTASASGTQFKVLLANVLASNGEHGRLSALLTEERPDFVFLQEVSDSLATELSTITELPHMHILPRHDNFGIAMLSRFPLDKVDSVASPPFGYPTIVAAVTLDGQAVTFASTHPMHPLGKVNYEGRNEQLADIARVLSSRAGPRLLVGDLNTTMWGASYRELVRSTGLRNARSGFGALPTWPTFFPIALIPIDHCMISDELDVIDIRTGPGIGSDHLPLIVTLSLD